MLQAATPVLAVTWIDLGSDLIILFNKYDFPTPAEPVIKTFL